MQMHYCKNEPKKSSSNRVILLSSGSATAYVWDWIHPSGEGTDTVFCFV